jgi:hypothetical protein
MNTIYRLEKFFPDRQLRLFELDVRKCEAYHLAVRTRVTKTGRASRWTATAPCSTVGLLPPLPPPDLKRRGPRPFQEALTRE